MKRDILSFWPSVSRKSGRWMLGLIALGILLGGCASTSSKTAKPSSEANASHEKKHTRPKGPLADYQKIVILPIKFSVYETSVGEVTEEMTAWSEEAQAHLMKALKKELDSHGVTSVSELKPEQLSSEQAEILTETQALFDVVGQSVWQHVQSKGQARFADRKITDYTLGSDVSALQNEADAYILLHGLDQISTGGRKAKQVATTVLLAVLGVVAVPAGGLTTGSLGVVDAETGEMLWLDTLARRGGGNIKTTEGATALVRQLMQKWR